MAANIKCDLMTKYQLEFNRMTSSKYSIYKTPSNLFENLINTLAVSRQQTRKDLNIFKCPLITTYNEWKERQFPEVEIAGEIFKACKYMDDIHESLCTNKKQIKITSFFKKGNISPEKSVGSDKGASVASSSFTPAAASVADATDSEEDKSENSINTNQNIAVGVKKLYEIFQIKGGTNVAMKIEPSENLNVVCQQVNPIIEDFLNKDRLLSEKATYFQHKSTLSIKKQEASNLIDATKKKMEDLHEYTEAVTRKDILKNKTISEVSKFVAHCTDKCVQFEKELIQNLLTLKVLLVDLKARYYKRIHNLKHKSDCDLIDIRAQNSQKPWDECMSLVEKIEDGTFNFSIENFEQTKNYFAWLARSKHEYSTPEDLLKYLGRVKSDAKKVVDVVVKYLPLICVSLKNKTLLLDCEQFFGSPMELVTFIDIVESKQKTIEEEKSSEASVHGKESMKRKRKPGSGRPAWENKRPDIVESVKEFSSNCGISAQVRRRDDLGLFGFGIPDVQRFISEKFFKNEPEKAPSQSSLRRFFSPPTKANRASSNYREIIKAKPSAKHNDATVGASHKHRHHAFTVVKAVREFSAKHEEEAVVISADDKCKLPIGPPIVSRLVNSRKFFLSGEEPNLPDHDIRSGMCITPNGYMVLKKNERNFNNLPTTSSKSMAEYSM